MMCAREQSGCNAKISNTFTHAAWPGFDIHKKAMPKANETLDDISHEHAPSRWLEEAAAQPRPAQQLGTLGGGNHFLEVLHSHHNVHCCVRPAQQLGTLVSGTHFLEVLHHHCIVMLQCILACCNMRLMAEATTSSRCCTFTTM